MPSVLTSPRPLLLLALILLTAGGIPGTGRAADSPWRVVAVLKVGNEVRPLSQPSGWFHDPTAGKVYVADPENNRLLSFTTSGKFLAEFNAGGNLRQPADLIKDGKGIFRVLEFGYPGVFEVDPANRTTARHEFKTGATAVYPKRIAASATGFVVLDRSGGSLIFYDGNYRETGKIACPDAGGFRDFILSGEEVLALSGSRIHRYSAAGRHLEETVLPGEIEFAVSLAIDNGGLIYLLDRHGGRIAVLQPGGKLLYTFLNKGENEGELLFPSLIRFDANGGLWLVDEGNNRVMVLRK